MVRLTSEYTGKYLEGKALIFPISLIISLFFVSSCSSPTLRILLIEARRNSFGVSPTVSLMSLTRTSRLCKPFSSFHLRKRSDDQHRLGITKLESTGLQIAYFGGP